MKPTPLQLLLVATVLCFVGTGEKASATLVTLADFQFPSSSPASADAGTFWTTSDIAGGTTGVGDIQNQGNPAPGINDLYEDFYAQNTGGHTLAEAIANDHYYGFTVAPGGPGVLGISYDTLTLDSRRSGGTGFNYSILASTDGTFGLANLVDSSGFGAQGTYSELTFDLTPLSEIAETVEFRIYLNPPANYTVGANTMRTDNIELTGTVVFVPEPSSALISAALLGLFSLRRRRRLIVSP